MGPPRQQARELMKPLFKRPCSPEERAVCDAVTDRIEELERIVRAKSALLDQIAEAAGVEMGQQYSGHGIISRLREQGRQRQGEPSNGGI